MGMNTNRRSYENIPQKRCKGCWSEKRDSWHPLTDFPMRSQNEDGHSNYCKKCEAKKKRQSSPDKVLILLAQGLSNREIADGLSLTCKTVSRYIQAVKKKTGIKNRVLLAFYALGKGLVTQEEIRAAIRRERRTQA